MLTLENAIIFAIYAHEGQKDLSGQPYILHPLNVMSRMDTDTERIVAVLHDVTEDSDCTLEVLISVLGLTEEISNALYLLDRNNHSDYKKMIHHIKKDYIATKVKIAYLEHNLDVKRIIGRKGLTEKDKERLSKYLWSWSYLKGD